MATPAIGNGTLMLLDTDGGGSTVKVAFEVDCELTITLDTAEDTNKDSVRRKGYQPTNSGWSISMTGNVDSQAGGDTTGLNIVETAMLTPAYLEWSMTESGTGIAYSGDIVVQNYSKSYPQAGIVTYTISAVGNGLLTVA